ncbi:hypothetical protein V8F20_005719 [Naviculisporaceae sp. PSN 640]
MLSPPIGLLYIPIHRKKKEFGRAGDFISGFSYCIGRKDYGNLVAHLGVHLNSQLETAFSPFRAARCRRGLSRPFYPPCKLRYRSSEHHTHRRFDSQLPLQNHVITAFFYLLVALPCCYYSRKPKLIVTYLFTLTGCQPRAINHQKILLPGFARLLSHPHSTLQIRIRPRSLFLAAIIRANQSQGCQDCCSLRASIAGLVWYQDRGRSDQPQGRDQLPFFVDPIPHFDLLTTTHHPRLVAKTHSFFNLCLILDSISC